MYFNNGTCQRCLSTYIMMNGRCFASIPNCQSYNQFFGTCVTCNNGYLLLGGQCLMIGSPEYDQASRIAVTSSTGNVTTTRTTTTSSLTRAVQIGS